MRCKTETLAVVHDFTFFTGTSNRSEFFALSLYTSFLFFIILAEFVEYQKYGECSDYYRLSYLRRILFLMHSLLVLLKLSISISGLSHGKVILQ